MAKLGGTTKWRGSLLVKITKEERAQLARLLQGHPWELTLKGFLARARSEYGFDLYEEEVHDPLGNLVKLSYLKSLDGRAIHMPRGLEMEEVLDELITASLCRRMGIPPEDFGLHAEDPDDGD
jgi:hypothetical protein